MEVNGNGIAGQVEQDVCLHDGFRGGQKEPVVQIEQLSTPERRLVTVTLDLSRRPGRELTEPGFG